MRIAFLPLVMCLTACAAFPTLDNRISAAARDAPYPALINIDPLLAQVQEPGATTPAIAQDIASRVANLNARAAGLRAPIIARPTLARMQRGIDRSALQ